MIGTQAVMVNIKTGARPHWEESRRDQDGKGVECVSGKDEEPMRLSTADWRLQNQRSKKAPCPLDLDFI